MGRGGTWVFLGNEDGGRTVIFQVYYLGQGGAGFSREVTRKIEVRDTQTLEDLHYAIIFMAFGWEEGHMYSFHLDNIPYSGARGMEYNCLPQPDPTTGEKPKPTSTKLKDLNLKEGQRFLFVFDFGDDQQFGIEVAGFGRSRSKAPYPMILERKGRAPKQYY
jgi:Plasmid pRiA4b ORF-3-like protein